MPFSDIYVSTFKNDIEYKQLLIQTAMALQTNKFIQVRHSSLLPSSQLGVPEIFFCWIVTASLLKYEAQFLTLRCHIPVSNLYLPNKHFSRS